MIDGSLNNTALHYPVCHVPHEPLGMSLSHLVSDLLIENLLPGTHGTLDDVLGLAGQLLLHLPFRAP